MNAFSKNVLRFTSKSILLYLGMITSDGQKDIIICKDVNSKIEISPEIHLNVKKINLLLRTNGIQPINVDYEVYFMGSIVYSCSYTINVHETRCFWNSDIKTVQVEQCGEIKHAKVADIETWSNKQFLKHFEETGHCKNINNRDTL